MVLFFLPAPPQYHEPSISSTLCFPICEPILISPTSYRNSPMGPPPFISFPKKILPSLGHAFHTGAPVSVFVHFSPKLFIIYYLLYKHLYLQSSHSLLSPLATYFLLATRNPCHPWIGAVFIIYPCQHRPYLQSTPPVSYLYPLNLSTVSRLWHNLAPVLSFPCHSTLLHGCG